MSKIGERLNRVLQPQSTLMSVIGRIGDFLLLGVMWLICALPVITVGAGSAAACSVGMKIWADEDYGVFRDFFRSFKENFKLATMLWLAALLFGVFLALDIYFYFMWASAGEMVGTILLAVFVCVTVIYFCTLTYLFPYAAKFDCTFRTAVKNSAFLSLRHAPVTLVMLMLDFGAIAAALYFSVLFAALPGIILGVNCFGTLRVIWQYLPKSASRNGENAD